MFHQVRKDLKKLNKNFMRVALISDPYRAEFIAVTARVPVRGPAWSSVR